MQIHFYAAADVAAIGVELTNQQAAPEADSEPVVATNDNGLRCRSSRSLKIGMRPFEGTRGSAVAHSVPPPS